ncbi:transcriptional regulator [Gordonia sp. 852002-51296_SCH5728562-b]|nr:transcriptional regulator [Gordonia sp. 852002-51296_SCH5728562-b]
MVASTGTRARIVAAADRLFYESGFENTSFADIADVVSISRGNFYHHFRTKDDLLHAVLDKRAADTRRMLAGWEAESDDPRRRLELFIEIVQRNRGDIERFGCPVGGLVVELAKLNHGAAPAATALLTAFADWLTLQFAAAGCGRRAKGNAIHLLAFSQGIAVLSAGFAEQGFVDREVSDIKSWLVTELDKSPVEE